jgi:amidase
VILPAYLTGLVGLRPTVGLIPRTGAIAFNVRADTIGPMARHVADVAVLLSVMAGSDAGDPLSADADQHKSNYVDALDANALAGIRLGVARFASIPHPPTMAVFENALRILRAKGAILVDIDQAPPKRALAEAPQPARGHTVLGEAHASYDEYLARTPPAVPVKSLADLVAFNRAHARQELFLYGQENFEKALASPPTPPTAESNARADARRQIARDQVDSLLRTYRVAALIAPSGLPATLTDVATRISVYPPAQDTPDTLMSLSARSAYPLLTVPMGQVAGLPVGLSISGTQWSEAQLLAIGYAFEQAARARRPPTFAKSIEALPEYEAAMQPQTVRGTQ